MPMQRACGCLRGESCRECDAEVQRQWEARQGQQEALGINDRLREVRRVEVVDVSGAVCAAWDTKAGLWFRDDNRTMRVITDAPASQQEAQAQELEEYRAELRRHSQALILAWGGVCPPTWAMDPTNPMLMAETIRAEGDRLQGQLAAAESAKATLEQERDEYKAIVEKMGPAFELGGPDHNAADRWNMAANFWHRRAMAAEGDLVTVCLQVDACREKLEAAEQERDALKAKMSVCPSCKGRE